VNRDLAVTRDHYCPAMQNDSTPPTRAPLGRRVLLGTALIVTVLLSAVTGAMASHLFSDVPTTNTFHDEITLLADAGVVAGYPDGTFRPGNAVTRGAMTAFLARGLGRVSSGFLETELTASSSDSFGVTITPSAVGNGGGWVTAIVTLEADVSTDANLCPCNARVEITDMIDESPVLYAAGNLTIPGGQAAAGTVFGNAVALATFPVPAGPPDEITIEVINQSGVTLHTATAAALIYQPLHGDPT
jgi:hypothetical protein